LNPDVLKGERIGKMFHPFGQTEGEMLEFLGAIVSYEPKKKWWHVVFDDGEEEDHNFRQLHALSTPPGFSLLQPLPPPGGSRYLFELHRRETQWGGSCA
jgi:hypothetical protein